jgi:hypothetical protein
MHSGLILPDALTAYSVCQSDHQFIIYYLNTTIIRSEFHQQSYSREVQTRMCFPGVKSPVQAVLT